MCDDISSLKIPARFSSLGILMARIAATCKDAGFDIDVSRRAELAVEELFANTINHGYRGECDRPVWLRVSATGAGVFIEYQDAGPPFDPFKPADRPANGLSPEPSDGGQGRGLIELLTTPSSEPPLGGQGLKLIKELATTSAYRRLDDRNVVSLEFVQN